MPMLGQPEELGLGLIGGGLVRLFEAILRTFAVEIPGRQSFGPLCHAFVPLYSTVQNNA